jgi:hypothetical protein
MVIADFPTPLRDNKQKVDSAREHFTSSANHDELIFAEKGSLEKKREQRQNLESSCHRPRTLHTVQDAQHEVRGQGGESLLDPIEPKI